MKKNQYDHILSHCLSGLPNEACGLLGGTVHGDEKTVEHVYLLTNTDQSPEHFSMEPKEQFAAIKDMRSKGLVLLGNFHSHPATPSRPSREDIRLAHDPVASYLILSLADRSQPVLKSFRIQNGDSAEEELVILQDTEEQAHGTGGL
ncbi:MAG: Mov34/MPN/PAD family protein [Paenibacillaceae bacterium]|jgi:proteasome lid subunit RPN8/RPN11|nr:Mov34/MPN/PAD family protein [Paenibacillaceae bacterium]